MNDLPHMFVPVLLVIASAWTDGLVSAGTKQNQKLKICLFVIIISLYAGLRSTTTMTDDYVTPYYWMRYASVQEIFLRYEGREPVFRLFVKAISMIFEDAQALFIIQALLVAACFGAFVYRNQEDPLMCFIIFLTLRDYSFAMCAMRQGIALAIVYGFCDLYMQRKQPIRFVLSVILASLFHSSAILFIFVYPLYNYIKNPYRFSLIIAVLSAVFYNSSALLVTILLRLSLVDQYVGYIERGYQVGLSTTLFLTVAILALSLLLHRAEEKHLELECGSYSKIVPIENLVAVSCMFAFVGTRYGSMIRMCYYTSQYTALLLPKLRRFFKQEKIVYFAIIFLLILQYGLFGPGQMGWNYHFFWTD